MAGRNHQKHSGFLIFVVEVDNAQRCQVHVWDQINNQRVKGNNIALIGVFDQCLLDLGWFHFHRLMVVILFVQPIILLSFFSIEPGWGPVQMHSLQILMQVWVEDGLYKSENGCWVAMGCRVRAPQPLEQR